MVDMITECLGVFNGFMWKLLIKSLSPSGSHNTIFLGGLVPPLHTGFPGVRVRKLMEAESAITRPPTIHIRLKILKIRLNSDSFLVKNQTKFRLTRENSDYE